MQLVRLLLLTSAYSIAPILGGGYQGCLERVLAFQAYEIDELNSASDRTVGVKCDKFDNKSKTCLGNWVACAGSRPGGRCDFNEFLRHMGKLPPGNDWPVYRDGSTVRLDSEATAKRCFENYETRNHGKPIRNFPPWQALKNQALVFNDYIVRLADVVDDTAQTRQTADNKYLWDDYDATRDRTIVVRSGDHGVRLVDSAIDKLGGVMEIKRIDLGPHPTDPTKPFHTLDWPGTAGAAMTAGVPNYEAQIDDFYDHFYNARNSQGALTADAIAAREHRAVNDAYKLTVDKANTCR